MRPALLRIGVCAGLAVGLSGGRSAAQDAADPVRIAHGKQLYETIGCSGCHGLAGQGGEGPMTGPLIARPDYPFAAFRALVRNPIGVMPPYSEKVLPDAALADIHAYLAVAFHPATVAEIPMLQAKPRK